MKLKLNCDYLGIIRVKWSNPGPVPQLDVTKEKIHFGTIDDFTGTRSHVRDDLFDYDAETGTTCWGSSTLCNLFCSRRGEDSFTIWTEEYSFRRGNHQLTFGMSHFNHIRCPQKIALAPGGLLYIIAKSKFSYGSLDEDYSMVIAFGNNVWKHKWDPSFVQGKSLNLNLASRDVF